MGKSVDPMMISAPKIDPDEAIQAFFDGADEITASFREAAYNANIAMNTVTRNAMDTFLQAQVSAMPFSQTATAAMAELRGFLGLKPISHVPEIESKMKNIASQLQVPGLPGMATNIDNYFTDLSGNLQGIDAADSMDSRSELKNKSLTEMKQLQTALDYDRMKGNLVMQIKGAIYPESYEPGEGHPGSTFMRTADYSKLSADDLEFLGLSEFDPTGTEDVRIKPPIVIRKTAGTGIKDYYELTDVTVDDIPEDIVRQLKDAVVDPTDDYPTPRDPTMAVSDFIGWSKGQKMVNIGQTGKGNIGDRSGYGKFNKYIIDPEGYYEEYPDQVIKGEQTSALNEEVGAEEMQEIVQQLREMHDQRGRFEGAGGLADKALNNSEPLDARNVGNITRVLEDASTDFGNVIKDLDTKVSNEVPTAPTGDEITKMLEETPGFQSQMDIQQKALERSQAARGVLNSGRGGIEVSGLAQGIAQQTYNAHVQRLGSLAGLNMPVTQQNISQQNAQGQFGAGLGLGQSDMNQQTGQAIGQSMAGAFGQKGTLLYDTEKTNSAMELQARLANQQADLQAQMFNAQQSNSLAGSAAGIAGTLLGGLF